MQINEYMDGFPCGCESYREENKNHRSGWRMVIVVDPQCKRDSKYIGKDEEYLRYISKDRFEMLKATGEWNPLLLREVSEVYD